MIIARDIAIEVGGRSLISAASFSVHDGDKIGLVGANGAGKTTLLRTLGWGGRSVCRNGSDQWRDRLPLAGGGTEEARGRSGHCPGAGAHRPRYSETSSGGWKGSGRRWSEPGAVSVIA